MPKEYKRKELCAEIIYISRDEALRIVKELTRTHLPEKYLHKVEKYRQWMEQGKWSIFWHPDTGSKNPAVRFPQDAVIFWDYGKLFEGAHRMRALAGCKENIKLPFLVIMGFPKSLKSQYDAWHGRGND